MSDVSKYARRKTVEIGRMYGRLQAVCEVAERDTGGRKYLCWCGCGEWKIVRGAHLTHGAIKSCGCLQRELAAERMRAQSVTHGQTRGHNRSPEYKSWIAMRARCRNPNVPKYHRYGGRGITICAEWDDFPTFLRDMGERPEGTTLDRIDNDGNYEPSNCRWATHKEQRANRTNPRHWKAA